MFGIKCGFLLLLLALWTKGRRDINRNWIGTKELSNFFYIYFEHRPKECSNQPGFLHLSKGCLLHSMTDVSLVWSWDNFHVKNFLASLSLYIVNHLFS